MFRIESGRVRRPNVKTVYLAVQSLAGVNLLQVQPCLSGPAHGCCEQSLSIQSSMSEGCDALGSCKPPGLPTQKAAAPCKLSAEAKVKPSEEIWSTSCMHSGKQIAVRGISACPAACRAAQAVSALQPGTRGKTVAAMSCWCLAWR